MSTDLTIDEYGMWRPTSPVTPRQFAAYQRRADRLRAQRWRLMGADEAHRIVDRSRYVKRARRGAWIKRELAFYPEAAAAYQRGDPRPTPEEVYPAHVARAPGAGVSVMRDGDEAIQIRVADAKGRQIASTHVVGDSRTKAAAINSALRFARECRSHKEAW